ncbi:MAG: MBL fold metallo-hydrolase [Alphaproteobacteria bacterium]|nr:MBL fold metallo-hydrolase [Alphaproteobacteria bacterium]
MTFRGTNTYLLGEVDIAVIDPGPDHPAHLQAILGAVGAARKISHVFVTHSHVDHSPLARQLADMADAPVLALGDSWTGRSALMKRLSETAQLGGGEGVDADFKPDICLHEGEVISAREWSLGAITTPGHFSNHLCFDWIEAHALFSGDHVMSWATTLVSPPDGDLTAFMNSLEKLQKRTADQRYFPGHGAPLEDPHHMLAHQHAHRKSRESQILAALEDGAATPLALTGRIYTEIPEALIPMAARNVFAHLIDLVERNMARPLGPLSPEASFHLSGKTP